MDELISLFVLSVFVLLLFTLGLLVWAVFFTINR